MRAGLNIVVGIPSTDYWSADFGMRLVHMADNFWRTVIQKFLAHGVPSDDVPRLQFLNSKGSILPSIRQNILDQAIKIGATHVLFIDSDQTFPSDTLWRLLQWNKPVVACNIATKSYPNPNPTARYLDPESDRGIPVYSNQGDTGLRKVWRVGCGVMLIELAAIQHLPRPWFNITWKESRGEHQGEDWYFCELCEKHGIPIYIDRRLSWEIGHVGKLTYTHSMIQKREEGTDALRKQEEGQTETKDAGVLSHA